MRYESKALEELHRIREQLYEETKHLSPEEHVARIRKDAEETCRMYNVHLPRLEKAKR